jgi:hypothetical protein
MTEFALQLPADAIEFSRGTTDKPETIKVGNDQWFADFVAKLPKQVAMAKDANHQGDNSTGLDMDNADAIAAAAVEYQAVMQQKGITISASAAVAHVTKGDK